MDTVVENAGHEVTEGATEVPAEVTQVGEQPTEWSPSYKFKVYDKEMEFPEEFRGFIKDSDTEKKFRELFEKSYALDEHKKIHQKVLGNLDEFKSQASDYRGKFEEVTSGLRKIYDMSQNDLDSFFDTYKIPEAKIIEWVTSKLREQELPDEERQYRASLRERARSVSNYEMEVERLRRQNESFVMSQHYNSLQMALSTPEVASFKQSFDARFGEGAFDQHVQQYGERVYSSEKRYVSPFDAVKAVMQYYSPAINTPPPVVSNGQEAVQGKPTIPNLGTGRGSSPVKPKFKNLDQMKKYVKENYMEG